MSNFITCSPYQKIFEKKEDEMGSACGLYWVKYDYMLSVRKTEGSRWLGRP
jgi:hypothetical protein